MLELARPALTAACRWVDERLDEMWSAAALFPSLKAAGELGHAADQLLQTKDARWVELGARWLDQAWTWLDHGALIRKLIASDPRLLPVAVTYLPFYLQGLRNPELLATITEQARHARLSSLEWTIVSAALDVLGIACSDDARTQARRISILATLPPPARIPIDAIYLLVHEYLYATRWGRSAPSLGAPVEAYLATAMPVLLDRACGLQDADLTAEVVILAELRGVLDLDDAWRVLHAAQTQDGAVHPPRRSEIMLPRIEHPTLGRTLHTTIAAIMAWTRAVRRSAP